MRNQFPQATEKTPIEKDKRLIFYGRRVSGHPRPFSGRKQQDGPMKIYVLIPPQPTLNSFMFII
jgi:hypothetical protein